MVFLPDNENVDALLAEQIAYYRARAGEYDDWWERREEYDLGPAFTSAWEADVRELRIWLDKVAPRGRVLELAAGTGNWTRELLRHADHVTAVDAAPETLALNAAKNGTHRVEYVTTDLFTWIPPARYDGIFFSFWISHVPPVRWEAFWDLVRAALAPGGRVFYCDSAHPEHVSANGPGGWPPAAGHRSEDGAMPRGEQRTRRVRDGSAFTIVKRYWHPAQLASELGRLGWHATVGQTTFAFLYGTARPHDDAAAARHRVTSTDRRPA